MSDDLRSVIIGAVAMGFAVAGLFFLRFWRQTGDRLFVFFAGAFFVLAINRVAFMFFADRHEHGEYPYWIRLIAFAMILAAILDKNLLASRATK
jgi:hypothetical protein